MNSVLEAAKEWWSDESEAGGKIPQKCNFPRDVYTSKKDLLNPLGSNVENGFGVIFLHANEIIMRAWSGYQKQALHLRCSRDVQTRSTFTNRPKHANQHQQNAQKNANYIFFLCCKHFFLSFAACISFTISEHLIPLFSQSHREFRDEAWWYKHDNGHDHVRSFWRYGLQKQNDYLTIHKTT